MTARLIATLTSWSVGFALGCGGDATGGGDGGGTSGGGGTASAATAASDDNSGVGSAGTMQGSADSMSSDEDSASATADTTEGGPCQPTPWADDDAGPWVVSTAPDGVTLGDAVMPATSADGRIVAFSSIFTADGASARDVGIIVVDNECGQRQELRGLDPSLVQLLVSGDGSTIVFIRGTDDPPVTEVYAFDRQSESVERIDVDPASRPVTGQCFHAAVSFDGRFVAFDTTAPGVTADDLDRSYDVFVRDRQTQTTELVSVTSDGTKANADSTFPAISADGRMVAFGSRASNLSLQTAFNDHVYVHDRQTGTTAPGSPQPPDLAANESGGFYPSMSSDARYVAFETGYAHLPADTDSRRDVYLYDRMTDTTELASVGVTDADAILGQVSDDGQFVVFGIGTPLVPSDVAIRDRGAGTTTRMSTLATGPSSGPSGGVVIAADGWLLFTSAGKDLAAPPLPPTTWRAIFMMRP